jgi:NAD(P)-dependent dehydrogenase (short-subunit alcohol dehydrogenase family)
MVARQIRGKIINFTSVHAHLGGRQRCAYAATKGAIEAFTRAAAWDIGKHGITVNVVAPGAIDTETWDGTRTPHETQQIVAQRVPLGRIGLPQDVAGAVGFLATSAADFITGQTLLVDGGRGSCDYLPGWER